MIDIDFGDISDESFYIPDIVELNAVQDSDDGSDDGIEEEEKVRHYASRYYEENREHLLERYRQYRNEHLEEYREKGRISYMKWRQKPGNLEKKREHGRRYYAAHKAEYKRYYEEHREEILAYRREYYQRKKTGIDRKEVKEK